MMFCQVQRSLPLMWDATQVTKEKLDRHFVQEELMRVNGQRSMPLLVGAAAQFDCHKTHLNELQDACAWSESARAFGVRFQTPVTQHVAAMGRMSETISSARIGVTCQSSFLEVVAKQEGIAKFDMEPDSE
jgi:hypothetical protein